MNNSGLMKNNQMVLTGVNTIGLVSLLAFVIRSFNEVNQSIEEIRSEFSNLRNNINENNKRANISFNRLNQKIEETTENYKKSGEKILESTENLVKVQSTYENRPDDITSAINTLMG